jgi:tripartite-type tricarboxylate transporter receptor subunit TctC
MCVVRALFCALVLIVAGGASGQTQPGQNWPSRPIKLIVPTGPGLATDIMARLLSEGVSRTLGQQMFVENMPGASGIVGAGAAARAPNDGYTFFFANASGLTSNMFMIRSLPYDPTRDYTAVAMVCDSGPFVVAVHPDLPAKTLAELIAYAKAQSGKLSYAVDASSGFGVVAGKLMNKRAGMEMVEVPYRATAQMLQDVATGTIQLMVSSVAASDAFVKAGKLRRIAISSERRFPGMEDLPTIGETLPGFVVDGWFAVVAPAGTPAPIVARLNQEIAHFLEHPAMRQRILGTERLGQPGSDDRVHPEGPGALARPGQRTRHRAAMTGTPFSGRGSEMVKRVVDRDRRRGTFDDATGYCPIIAAPRPSPPGGLRSAVPARPWRAWTYRP